MNVFLSKFGEGYLPLTAFLIYNIVCTAMYVLSYLQTCIQRVYYGYFWFCIQFVTVQMAGDAL